MLTSLCDSHFKEINIRFHETKVDGKDLTTAFAKTAESICEGYSFHRLCTWRSGYCYLNKGECNLNQSKDDSFVEQVAKNNS